MKGPPSDHRVVAARLGLPTYVVVTGPMRIDAMGELWNGRDRRRGVDVVIKAVPDARRARLEAESRATARAGPHPHLLSVAAVGTGMDGCCWMITDLAVGGTIAERATVDVATRVAWAGELVSAVAHLHVAGVVHGDITPHNVLLDGTDRVLLADLGAAVLVGDRSAAPAGGYTPRFAAPERRRGTAATTESDMFGFGATMLEVLGGDGGSTPRRVRRLLLRCTDRRPHRRPTAAAVARRIGPQK